MAVAAPQSILTFWFGSAEPAASVAKDISARWFKKDAGFDSEIRTRFGDTTEAALDGDLEDWLQDAIGRRAYVLALDQFTRNLFRGNRRAYAGDERALAAAATGIAGGQDRDMGTPQAAFLYMPYMHSEDLHHQNASVALFEALAAHREGADENLRFARAHRDVILRFGRFPHRNDEMGRASTTEEAEYLAQPGAGF